MKIAPETALKLTFNDAIKHVVASDPEYITPMERMVGGAIAGASAQVTVLWHQYTCKQQNSPFLAGIFLARRGLIYQLIETCASARTRCAPSSCLKLSTRRMGRL